MKLIYLITIFQILILNAQSRLDSLYYLVQQFEDEVTKTTIELDSLQKIY